MEYNVTLPSKPRIVSEEGFSGVYEIDGLFPGYGHTLGNSLRRIVLSSLPGAAITSVKIEGAQHEFSTLDHVKEDVITILLNLKRVRIALHTDEPTTLSLSVTGPKAVTAGDITAAGQVTILNPEQHIAELTAKAPFSVEIRVEKGLGYVSREVHQGERVEIGAIALDATFSPIRRVNYEVENMRVGDRTDFNRLRIAIETDGTVTPRQALEKSIETLIHQLKAIIGFKEEERKEIAPEDDDQNVEEKRAVSDDSAPRQTLDQELFKTRIETLKLSARTINALTSANIRTIGGLARKKEEDILAIEGLGMKGLQEIKRALGEYGITLK
jgi:DNA-directed RNA polymerase subunit alpha